MKLSATLALLSALYVNQPAFADAYLICESPMLGGVTVLPENTSGAGDPFSVRLTAIDSALRPLGLPATQEYLLRGTFPECSYNPASPHASFCDSYSGSNPGGIDVTALGLVDHSLKVLHFFGMSLRSEVQLRTNEVGTLNYLNVELRLDLDGQRTVKERFLFALPLPASPENSPSQCN